MRKKGQAAMEFLMTYGWAILAAIIAIGVLGYFGVFSPGKYVTGTALVTPPFYINAHNVKPAGVTLEIKNQGGETYDLISVDVTNCAKDSTGWAGVTAGSSQAITITCTTAPVVGENFKGDITISYRKVGSVVDLTSTGTIAEKITA